MPEPTTHFMREPLGVNSAPSVADERHARVVEVRTPPRPMRSTTGETRPPHPYANGWFAVCFSHEVKPGAVRIVPFAGQDLVIYRTQSGLARAIDPYCPHLGAHLGHGGKVDGENLVCPFHGLSFGPDGGCVRACAGQTPPNAALTGRYMKEMNGAIMVWRHSEDRPPDWDIPEMDLSGRLNPRYGSHELEGYFDSMVENSMDLTHFGWVHGFTETALSHEVDGHKLIVTITARWKGQRFHSRLTNFGLGFTRGENALPDLGVQVVTLAFATPVEPMKWTFRWSDNPSVARFDRWPAPLRKLAYQVLNPLAHRWLISVVGGDFPIWDARTRLPHPKLMAGERSFTAFRRWSAQFYPPTSGDDAQANHVLRMSAGR